MKRRSKVLTAALAAMMCLGLVACGKEFDAAGYTKSVLDANYHEEYAKYAEFRNLSEKEAAKEIEDNRTALAERELTGIGEPTEEKIAAYVASTKTLEKLAKYEVKEAKEQEDGSYIVTVEITPSLVYTKIEENSAALTEEMIAAGESPLESEQAFFKLLNESIARAVEANEYDEPTTFEVKVTADESGAYGIDESQMADIQDALFIQP